MAPPTLLAKGLCRNGHVIASEADLVGRGRHRQCRECRYETNRRWRDRERDEAFARREAEYERHSRQWLEWISGKRRTEPRPPQW